MDLNHWRLIYENPLSSPKDVERFRQSVVHDSLTVSQTNLPSLHERIGGGKPKVPGQHGVSFETFVSVFRMLS
jgi:hypothetical protein